MTEISYRNRLYQATVILIVIIFLSFISPETQAAEFTQPAPISQIQMGEHFKWTNPEYNEQSYEETSIANSEMLAYTTSVYSLPQFKAELKSKLNQRVSSFSINYTGNAQALDLSSIYNEIVAEDDYLYYSIRSVEWLNEYSDSKAAVSYTVAYLTSYEQEQYVEKEVQRILAEIISPLMNDDEKQKAIHDYIITHVAYDETLVENSAYAALARKTTVCQGYALLTYKMMQEAGISCMIVGGYAGDNLPATNIPDKYSHAWNLVKIDDKWYHLDVTHDDPTPDQPGEVQYDNYNLSDEQISINHVWDRQAGNYPVATTDYYQELRIRAQQPDHAARIEQLIRGLDLQYLMPEYTANNLTEFTNMVKRSMHNRDTELSLRTWPSVVSTINLSDVYDWDTDNILAQFSYSVEPYASYSRTADKTDIIYSLSFSYKNNPDNSFSGSELTAKTNIALDHPWTIRFNMAVNPVTINSDNIYICNNYGQKLDTIAAVKESSQGKEVSLQLARGQYNSGSNYYIYVSTGVKSSGNIPLPHAWRLKFTTQ